MNLSFCKAKQPIEPKVDTTEEKKPSVIVANKEKEDEKTTNVDKKPEAKIAKQPKEFILASSFFCKGLWIFFKTGLILIYECKTRERRCSARGKKRYNLDRLYPTSNSHLSQEINSDDFSLEFIAKKKKCLQNRI